MAKDMIVKAIETMLMGTPSGMAKMGPRIKNLIDKAGMQSKQGKRRRLRPGLTPRTGSKFGPRAKTNGKEGSMVESFRKNRKKGKRAI